MPMVELQKQIILERLGRLAKSTALRPLIRSTILDWSGAIWA
jgi:hypothetical protein